MCFEQLLTDSILQKGVTKSLQGFQGFIRNQMFELKNWLIPGYPSAMLFEEEWVGPNQKMYKRGTQMLKSKRVADVVEALIGAFLSHGGEVAAVAFMNWLGIEVDFSYVLYNRGFHGFLGSGRKWVKSAKFVVGGKEGVMS